MDDYIYLGILFLSKLLNTRTTGRYQLKIIQVYAPTTCHTDEETYNLYNTIAKIPEKQSNYTIVMVDLRRNFEDNQIDQKGRQGASAWTSKLKEETHMAPGAVFMSRAYVMTGYCPAWKGRP